MTRQYAHLGSTSDWLTQFSHAARPTRSSTQIWVVTRYLYQNQMFRRYEVIKISYLDEKRPFKTKIFCLGGAELLKSAIQMENSCFYQNQVFRRCRISYLDGKQLFLSKSGVQEVQSAQNQLLRWKTAVLSRSGVQEVQSAQNQLFRWKKAVFIKIRCLGGTECSKSAIQMENSCLYQNYVFRRCRVLKISYLDGKQLFLSKSGVQEVQKRVTF